MPTTAFNLSTNQKAERKLFAVYVDVSSTQGTYDWEIQGAGVEDSSLELNPDTETITDILGITETTINKLEVTQSFDPNTIRGGQKLNYKLLDIVRRNAVSELANFNVLRVWGVLGTGPYEAEVDTGCTITPQSIGGSSYLDMPMEISYSGNRILGKTDKIAPAPIVFTPN